MGWRKYKQFESFASFSTNSINGGFCRLDPATFCKQAAAQPQFYLLVKPQSVFRIKLVKTAAHATNDEEMIFG
jgi:hypothetical protein